MMKYKKTVILLTILFAIFFYILFSGTVIVKPDTTVIVKEIAIHNDQIKLKSRPLTNNGEKSKFFFKQPAIPGTGIGYIDEIFNKSNPYTFKTSFAFYTLDQITTNNEDKNKVRAYTISGSIKEIKNWDSFLSKLDINDINSRRSPYSRMYDNRVELLAEQLKNLLRTNNPEQYYPYGAGTEESIQNIGQKINFLQKELISRRNFLVAL
ncbi:MAG: hypothetical protein GY756_04040, partial [bacterium]|nr:hypothetical protein [bacterium]